MPRKKKKERGRPMELRYPPRIDATPEEVVQAMFRAGPVTGPVSGRTYYCGACQRAVYYPEVLYRDGLCTGCHNKTE